MKIYNVSQICTELGKISFTSNLDTLYLVITEIMSSTKKYPPTEFEKIQLNPFVPKINGQIV
jgi:hypothetical protein